MWRDDSRTIVDAVTDRALFRTDAVTFGEFRCGPASRRWSRDNYADGYLLAFARDPVVIRHADRDAVVADANQVMFYNLGQAYRRARIGLFGDRCEYLMLSSDLAMEIGSLLGQDPRARAGEVFPFTSGPARATVYVVLRRIYQYLLATPQPDALRVEESVLQVVHAAIEDAAVCRGASRRSARRPRAEHAEVARALLAAAPSRALTLADIAAQVGISVYHLCRVFRARTGLPIYRYRDRLRTRAALEPLADGVSDLTGLAYQLGYSSHSHFTGAFRREFGMSPSAYRAASRLMSVPTAI